MYQKLPNLVLGFHGCNRETFEKVIYEQEGLKQSENTYDWLGHGIYFWEQNLTRAQDWAKKRYGEENAYVVGAVIDLGYCLNLTDSHAEEFLRMGYELLVENCKTSDRKLPSNRQSKKTIDILLRDLDCAVIEHIHEIQSENDELQEFDSVRGVFVEGEPPYRGSAFRAKTHVQICVRNPNCIKGYFKPIEPNKEYEMP